MIVFVTGRHSGKTAAMIEWLLKGQPLRVYPYWSRAIVCSTHEEVLRVTELVREATERPSDEMPPWTNDLRKCIWGIKDLQTVYLHHSLPIGKAPFELGVDNLDYMLHQMFGWTPAFVTMTGELYDNVSPTAEAEPAEDEVHGRHRST